MSAYVHDVRRAVDLQPVVPRRQIAAARLQPDLALAGTPARLVLRESPRNVAELPVAAV